MGSSQGEESQDDQDPSWFDSKFTALASQIDNMGREMEQMREQYNIRDWATINPSASVIKTGPVNALIYWFVQDFGWGLNLNTLESSGYSQAAFLVKETLVEKGSEMSVSCQFEKGLIQLSVT